MKRKAALVATAALAIPTAIAAQHASHPNVVFIIADDLGYGDLGCYGQERFDTPNIDRLALHGMRFTGCYAGTTVSAPSRCSLVTGLHTGHTAIRGNHEVQPEGQRPLPAGTPTIFRLFRQAGYSTGVFGKWGLGYPGSEGAPEQQGVDEFFGYNCQRQAHKYYPQHLWHNTTKIPLPANAGWKRGLYAQDLIQEQALAFIDRHRDKPFFAYVSCVLPHAELVVPDDTLFRAFSGRYPETKPYQGDDNGPRYGSQQQPRAAFAAMVTRLDRYVGQLIDRLKQLGIYDNTLVIFTSDNGPHREGGADPDFFNSNGIWRGTKRDLYEGGIRVPLIAAWPARIPAATHTDQVCAFWDMMPTFAQLAGVASPPTDGISLVPTLTRSGSQPQHDYLYFEFQELGGRQAIRQGDWKLLRLDIATDGGRYELYNLAADPSERHNLAADYPDIVDRLKQRMQQARIPDSNN